MKRVVMLIVVLFLVITGCAPTPRIIIEPATEDSLRSMTYDGQTTYWAEELPVDMIFETGAIALNTFYIGESDTGTGYADVVQVEFVFSAEMDEKERYWFFKDDFTAFLYIKNEDLGINESYRLENNGFNDLVGVQVQTLESAIYFSAVVQSNGRYSLEGSQIKTIMTYSLDDINITYCFDGMIDETHMAKFGKDGECTFIGDDAADFIARKAGLLSN